MPKPQEIEIEIEVDTNGRISPFDCPQCGKSFPGQLSSGNDPHVETTCPDCKTRIKGRPARARLNGRICWAESGPPCAVMGAIVQPEEIAFDTSDGTWKYTVSLKPSATSSLWGGRWRCPAPPSEGHVDARRYDCPDGGIVLIGNWRDDEGDWYWFLELRP